MKKWIKHLLVAGVVVSFGLSIPNVITKHRTETSSQTVELAVDYKQVYSNAQRGDDKFENQILKTLKRSGVNSIGFTENSLSELENRELVHVMTGSELENNIWSQNNNFPIKKQFTYVLVPGEAQQKEIINTIKNSMIGKTKEFKIKDTNILQINERKNNIYKLPLLYLESDYKKLHKLYTVVPRISNNWGERFHLINSQLEVWNKKRQIIPSSFYGE